MKNNKTINIKMNITKEDLEGRFIDSDGKYGSKHSEVKMTDEEWNHLVFELHPLEPNYSYWDEEVRAFICRTLHRHLDRIRLDKQIHKISDDCRDGISI